MDFTKSDWVEMISRCSSLGLDDPACFFGAVVAAIEICAAQVGFYLMGTHLAEMGAPQSDPRFQRVFSSRKP